MEIKINSRQDECQLILDNDDSRNFVDLQIGTSEASKLAISVDLDELLSAVHAFEHERVLQITRENKYQE